MEKQAYILYYILYILKSSTLEGWQFKYIGEKFSNQKKKKQQPVF